MKIAIAQINCTVGDIDGNAERIRAAIIRAQAAAADLLLTPELSLCGYSPEDLLLRDDFIAACAARLEGLARNSDAMAVVVGHPAMAGGQLFNCASVLRGGRIEATYRKQCLPNCGVFDEMRYFAAGSEPLVIPVGDARIGLLICADAWETAPAIRARDAGADLLAVINASPWHQGKDVERVEAVGDRVADTGLGVIYANLVGGGAELVFDGGSFAMDGRGERICQLPPFREAFAVIEADGRRLRPGPRADRPGELEAVWQALVLGVRDYCGKNGYCGALVDLDGGLGAVLALGIAVEALGPGTVFAALPPAGAGRAQARAIAARFGAQAIDLPLEPARATRAAAKNAGAEWCAVRAFLLASLARRHGHLLLAPGDKTEYALGVMTPGREGLAILADVSRTQTLALARLQGRRTGALPARMLARAAAVPWPAGNLSVPGGITCEMLDAIIAAYVEHDLPPEAIATAGFSPALVARVVACIDRGETFRRQAPPAIRVTPRAFGRDRRYPPGHRYRAPGAEAP